MVLINICGFLFMCLFLSWHYKERLVTVLPCGTGILIFLLYILAFFQKLNFINIINFCLIFLCAILIIKRKDFFHHIKSEIVSAPTIIMFITYLIIFLCVKDKMVLNGDDLRVWGIEVKSIYFTNGFADKFKVAAIAYADYFPGQMLFEWWTCHFSPYIFREGLIYVGYYWLYATFLMPVLKYIAPKKKYYAVLVGIVWTIFIMLLPAVVDTMGYAMLSVELLLSAVFAYCLFQYIDIQKHDVSFSFLNLMFCTMQLMLLKETGVLYAALSLLFGCVILSGKKERGFFRNVDLFGYKGIVIISFVSSIPVIVWKIYCKVYERSKHFDGIIKDTVTSLWENHYQGDENASLYIKSFFRALIKEPLHGNKTVFLDITVVLCILLVLCLFLYDYKKGHLSGKECLKICLFYIVSFMLSSFALMCMHIFVFREGQYIDAAVMIISISRYLEPMFLGFLIFLLYALMPNGTKLVNKRNDMIVYIGIIVLCTNYESVYSSIINYRCQIEDINTTRKNIVQNCNDFFDDLQQIDTNYSKRILYLRSVNDFQNDVWVDESLLRYLVAPNSLSIRQIASDESIDEFREIIKYEVINNHCECIFFDDIGADFINAASVESVGCMENTLMYVSANENGDIVFNNVK